MSPHPVTHRGQAWVVSLTPFDGGGGLDETALRAHFERLRATGIGIYVASSNAGEGFTLSAHERARVFEIAAEVLQGRVPVRAGGCEPQSIADAIGYVRAAAQAGLDAAHLFPLDNGHAGTLKPGEMERYYREVLDHTDLPLVLSNYPSLGHVLPLELVERLLNAYPQVISLRDAGGDTGYLRSLVALCAGRAEVYTGGIRNLGQALMHGSQGFLSSEANLAPALAMAAVQAFFANDLAAYRRSHEQLYRLHEFVNRFGGPAGRGIKPLLARLGLPGGSLRAPRMALPPEEIDAMLAAYRLLDLPGAPTPLK